MTRQRALRQLMLELLYPAVLGAVIFSLFEKTILPLVQGYLFRSSQGSVEAATGVQITLLVITAAFYCVDYLYVMFSKNYDWAFFLCDIAFLVGLYVTVTAIGLSGAPRHPPYLRWILVMYCFFLLLYLWWDWSERRKCTGKDERRWYSGILAWEVISLLALVALILALSRMGEPRCSGYVVAGVLAAITLVFAVLTWGKKRYCAEMDGAAMDQVREPQEVPSVGGGASEVTSARYLEDFSGTGNPSERRKEALTQALDIRKFEIDLYWKRAAYFWAFIAAAFAGYFALRTDGNGDVESRCLVACLGFVFSVAWYFVNRGSKAWQRNWELHVDLLEDEVMGPLYKSVLNRYSQKFRDLTDSYPFSPSRINLMVGLFVILVWFFLMVSTLTAAWGQSCWRFWECAAISTATLAASGALFGWGRTEEGGLDLRIYRNKRTYR